MEVFSSGVCILCHQYVRPDKPRDYRVIAPGLVNITDIEPKWVDTEPYLLDVLSPNEERISAQLLRGRISVGITNLRLKFFDGERKPRAYLLHTTCKAIIEGSCSAVGCRQIPLIDLLETLTLTFPVKALAEAPISMLDV